MDIEFVKMQIGGSDGIYIDFTDRRAAFKPENAVRLCNRSFGIGADCVTIMRTSSRADVKMTAYRNDGSMIPLYADGILCIGKLFAEKKDSLPSNVSVETEYGVMHIHLSNEGKAVGDATVDLGNPSFRNDLSSVVDGGTVLTAAEQRFSAFDVSLGCRHRVLFCKDVASIDIDRICTELSGIEPTEADCRFVFTETVADNTFLARAWTKNVGELSADGTSACCINVAAAQTGRTARKNEIYTYFKNGTFKSHWTNSGNILLTATASEIYRGTVKI